MKVSTTPVEGLYLKFFVLKIDGSDPAAIQALREYADFSPNEKLRQDIYSHLEALRRQRKR